MNREQWIQVNVALSREGRDTLSSARDVFSSLLERLPAWRRQRAVKCAFFMRKPPDLRLRLLVADPATGLQTELRAMLRGLRATGAVARSFFSVYEPETRLFGGPGATQLIHRYFDADTTGWLELDRIAQAGQRTALPPYAVSWAVLNDLFLHAIGDRFEVWDVWHNLAILTRAQPVDENDAPRPGVVVIESLRAALSEQENRALDRLAKANRALAKGLRGLQDRGRLNVGLRALMPFIAMFHLNRHGYDQAGQAALAAAMCRAWDPRAGLHGADPSPPKLRPLQGDEPERRAQRSSKTSKA